MFVIPPCSLHESYFNTAAETTWVVAEKEKAEMCTKLKEENQTLVIRCTMEDDDKTEFLFHYRYFKGILYCFIEEPD